MWKQTRIDPDLLFVIPDSAAEHAGSSVHGDDILILESATPARTILVECFIPMRIELVLAPVFVVCQSHDVYTEKTYIETTSKTVGWLSLRMHL